LIGKKLPLTCVEDERPTRGTGPRVLVENGDVASLAAHAAVLRDAGYTVATCTGPVRPQQRTGDRRSPASYWSDEPELRDDRDRTVCPIVTGGRCPLVEGADAIITTTDLVDGEAIVRTLSERRGNAVVVERTAGVTAAELLAAVKSALP
jgi:hypothetical protein